MRHNTEIGIFQILIILSAINTFKIIRLISSKTSLSLIEKLFIHVTDLKKKIVYEKIGCILY